jgi:phenylpropionate dioxygenase-like ring-hydroxylating dioxygenase large terminal subunit
MERTVEELLAAYDDGAPLEAASTIPGAWYTEPRLAELEKRAVFARSWQVVGRVDQVAEPGQYLTADVAGEPIVVVRGQDSVLRAFFNVCRHHAAAVMTECEGRAERLRCPYHGWTYALDGSLKGLTEFEDATGFDRTANGLVPVSVATWEKQVFVHLDREPPPIDDWLGERLRESVAELRLSSLHFAGRREFTIGCNWKVFVDNYLDGGYHVPFLHRGLNSVLSFKEYAIECFDRVCLQSSPIDSSRDGRLRRTVDAPGVAPPSDATTAAVRTGRAAYYWLYPNLMLNWYEGYLDTNLVVPLGVDRTKVIFDFYFADVSESALSKNEQSMSVSVRIQDEDHAICESVQRGLGSRAYEAGRLSPRREAGENLFHRLLAADLRAGRQDRVRSQLVRGKR